MNTSLARRSTLLNADTPTLQVTRVNPVLYNEAYPFMSLVYTVIIYPQGKTQLDLTYELVCI